MLPAPPPPPVFAVPGWSVSPPPPLPPTASVEVDDEKLILYENQSTYIPLGSKHRLSNPGKIPLILIEVQSGTYLGEDDIKRFEDSYGRLDN